MTHNIITPKYKNGIFIRQNQSFAFRKGRITKLQLKSIEEYWSIFGIDYQVNPLDFSLVFKNNHPIILEIGFGSGNSLVQTAMRFPNINFLGIEVYPSGIGSCLYLSYINNIKNLKIIYYSASEVIDNMILNNMLSKIQIFFPDPWPKKKHHKRRMLQYYFLKKILKKLIFGGILHITTDSEEYAHNILNSIKKINYYLNLSNTDDFIKNPINYITTNFEKKAYLLGNKIFHLMFQSQLQQF